MENHNSTSLRPRIQRRLLAWMFAASAGSLVLSCSSGDDPQGASQRALSLVEGVEAVEAPDGRSSFLAPQPQAGTTCMRAFDSLDLLQVVHSAPSVYIQVRHRSSGSNSQSEEAAEITLKALSGTTGKVIGGAGKIGAGVSWVAIPADKLPIGQSEVVVRALGLTVTVPIVKDAAGQVQYLSLDAREDLIWSTGSVGVLPDDSAKMEVW